MGLAVAVFLAGTASLAQAQTSTGTGMLPDRPTGPIRPIGTSPLGCKRTRCAAASSTMAERQPSTGHNVTDAPVMASSISAAAARSRRAPAANGYVTMSGGTLNTAAQPLTGSAWRRVGQWNLHPNRRHQRPVYGVPRDKMIWAPTTFSLAAAWLQQGRLRGVRHERRLGWTRTSSTWGATPSDLFIPSFDERRHGRVHANGRIRRQIGQRLGNQAIGLMVGGNWTTIPYASNAQ